MAFSQKSKFFKVTTTVHETDTKAIQSELSLWANLIKDELDLLMARSIENEAQESSRFRELSTRIFRSNKHHQSLVDRIRILDLFSEHEFETTWKQTRKLGNTNIFTQTADYKNWKEGSESSTLVYTGKLGSGKSVVLANIVDDLTTHVEGLDATVAYFFCRHDLSESLNGRTIIGALGRQLLRSVSDFSALTVADKTYLSSDEITSQLKQAIPSNSGTYIVLDGLHLCNRSTRGEVSAAIRTLQQVRKVSVCVSYRLAPDSATDIPKFFNTKFVPQPDNGPDVEAFIETELERCLTSRSLTLGDPTLVLEIQDALLKGSHGMFLWVSLQIRSLCSMITDGEIKEALSDLPQNLTQIYNRILDQPLQMGRSYQTDIFKLVVAAKRPLTTDEMREALSVTPGDTVWDPSKLINNVHTALASCGCLIVVDEEEHTIRTVHPSVDMFLLARGFETHNHPVDPKITMETAEKLMLSIITTYLSYGMFGTELSVRQQAVEFSTVPSEILNSMPTSTTWVRSMALKLLSTRRQAKFDASRSIAERLQSHRSSDRKEFHFFTYAKTFALRHALELRRLPRQILVAFDHNLRQGIIEHTPEHSHQIVRLALYVDGGKKKEQDLPSQRHFAWPYLSSETSGTMPVVR